MCKDLLTMPEEEIPGMRVLMTMVGGKVVYRRDARGTKPHLTPSSAQ